MERWYISVIGGSRCKAAEYALAEEVGRLIAGAGATLVCGGLSGVMEAAARGAKEAGGTTIGILPGHDRSLGNPYLDYVLTTGIGHARNLAVVSSGDAVIAVGGGFGTLSEVGLAAKIDRPVVILGGWRLQNEEGTEGVWYASSAAEAMALVKEALSLPEDRV
jgi:uncharacterized protein (TIGR00725 family)